MRLSRLLPLTLAGLMASSTTVATAQQNRVTIKAQPSVKLSPELTAARLSGGTFVGWTRGGEAVVDIERGQFAKVQQLFGEQRLSGTPVRFEKLEQLIVMYHPGQIPDQGALESAGLLVVKRYPGCGFLVVRPQSEGVSAKSLSALEADRAVKYVEPNYPIRLPEPPAVRRRPRTNANSSPPPTNDPEYQELWGMENIAARDAWRKVQSSDVVVAVIDTGVDYLHEDLRDNMWQNPGEIRGNGEDDDGNGHVDDVFGYDFHNKDSDPMDDQGHGTHCAGTIAAVGNNDRGVVGVCWGVKIMALKFLGKDGGSTVDAVLSINYAVENGARVLSNSWGGGGRSKALEEAIWRAESKGVLFVAAAGNEGSDNDNQEWGAAYPASYPQANIISVAAIDEEDHLADFSCYGRVTVDIGAPGVGVYSTMPSDRYASMSGTSMACPHVAGAAALLWGHPYCRNRGYAQIKHLLLSNAREIQALEGKCVTEAALNIEFLKSVQLESGPILISSSPQPSVVSTAADSFGATIDPTGGQGVRIRDVVAGSLADKVGFEPHDVILEINGSPISSAPEFYRTLVESGTVMRVRVRNARDGSIVNASVPLPAGAQLAAGAAKPNPDGLVFGVRAKSAAGQGLKITAVAPGSPADKAGFEPNDTILEINGRAINSEVAYSRAVDASGPMMRVRVQSYRDGKTLDVDVQLSRPTRISARPSKTSARGVVFGGRARATGGQGVRITEVVPRSPANNAGLERNDVILEINGRPIRSEADYSQAIDQSGSMMQARVLTPQSSSVVDVQIRLNK